MKQFEDNNNNNTYYSIIYLKPRPYISEQFSIGLVLMNSNNIKFQISNDKLKQLNGILSKNQTSTANHFFNNFKNEVKTIQTQINKYNSQILPINLNIDSKINFDFLNKISISYNNLISFSEPIYIDLEINDDNFKNLFSKMIYSHDIIPKTRDNDFIKTKRAFKETIKNNVNLDVKADNLVELLSLKKYEVPVNLDALGMNGVPFTTQFIDFNLDIAQLNNKILSYLTLIKQSTLKEGKNFIVYNDTIIKQSQEIISDLNNESFVNMKPYNELDYLKDYIFINNVHPFIKA